MSEQKNSKDVFEKAKQTKNAEEFLALAKENGMEMTVEEAEKVFAKLHQAGELSDEELSNVAGGSLTFSSGIAQML
ncbi:MAG: Nif11-like leader peptide family RiPP precursor [Lachnospiraceae bacterium]